MKICLVVAPFKNPSDAKARIDSMVKWLCKIATQIDLVTGNFPYSFSLENGIKVNVSSVKYNFTEKWIGIRIVEHIFLQIKIALSLIKTCKNSDVVVFWLCGTFIFPMIIAKLLKRKIVLFVTGSWSKTFFQCKNKYLNYIISYIIKQIEKITYIMADSLIVLSSSLKNEVNSMTRNKHHFKCKVLPARPIDVKVFKPYKEVSERKQIIGYVGRLDKGKGVFNLIKAIKNLEHISLLIIGGGPILEELMDFAKKEGVSDRIKFTGWVNMYEVSKYLNEMKLLVLPSVSEGLPVSVLEAMAAGTPVLTTSVGGLPDIIKEGQTGFILQNNTSDDIYNGIKKALNNSKLDLISNNASNIVKDNYSYDALAKEYITTFKNLI